MPWTTVFFWGSTPWVKIGYLIKKSLTKYWIFEKPIFNLTPPETTSENIEKTA